MDDTSHLFRLHNDLAEVPSLRDLFAQACAAAGVAEEEAEACKLALTELVNNSIEHGCSQPSDVVEGWYRITESDIEIEVTDPSVGLTDDDFKLSDCTDFAENGRGAGLFLIQAMTDEVAVRRGDNGGTTVRLVKHRKQAAS